MPQKTKETARLMKMATFFSVAVAILIIIVKVGAWVVTDSLSLLSSLVDSVMDVTASFVSFMAVRYSLEPADEDHRFGHGRAEDIASFSQSMFIAGSGIFIVIEAVGRFINPVTITNEMVGIGTMIFSIIMTLILLSFQRYVIAKTHSSAVKADALHYKTDLLVNVIVILSFILSKYMDMHFIDTILAIVIAAYIFSSAWKVGRGAFDKLMDREFEDNEREKIITAVLSHKDVRGLHDLRTRSLGIKPFIQLHLEMDGDISLKQAHKISDEVELKILEIYPDAEVIIHQDIKGKEVVGVDKGAVVSVGNGE